jgi:hypothetical protein
VRERERIGRDDELEMIWKKDTISAFAWRD